MASTNLIADMQTVYNNGPSAVTKANSIAPAGEIMDYPGLTKSARRQAEEAFELLTAIKGSTDASDPNLTNINAVLGTLNGGGGPTGTVLTALKAVISTGPTAATTARAIAPQGEIMDYPGNLGLCLLKLQQMLGQVTALYTNTDNSTDSANKALLLGVQTGVIVRAFMVTAEITGLGVLDALLRSLPGKIEAGVKVSGEAAGYALVWEFGRADINPGPKTVRSTNPNGEERVLTLTAPHGWIRVNRTQYEELLSEKVKALHLSGTSPTNWPALLRGAVEDTATESMEIMRATAPEDTGLLKDSLSLVRPGDPLLDESDDGELSIGMET